jgi:hypothetical protein
MKKLFVGVALVAAIAACKSQTNQATSDAASPTAPKAKPECCSTMKEKGACTAEQKAECSSQTKTCPVSGAKIN